MRVAVLVYIALVVCAAIAAPTPQRETVIRYVDEHGNIVSPEVAAAYFAEQARLEAIERESLERYKASRAQQSAGYSGSSFSGGTTHWTPPRDLDGTGASNDSVRVRGYYRKDGTYVRPHMRSRANDTQRDNWSTRGNRNPHTGKAGRKSAAR